MEKNSPKKKKNHYKKILQPGFNSGDYSKKTASRWKRYSEQSKSKSHFYIPQLGNQVTYCTLS